MRPLLEIAGLTKRFTRGESTTYACREVDLRIQPGEIVGLVGESGSGKSTLGNLVLGLLAPDAGTIRFDGEELPTLLRHDPRRYRSSVQAVFQQPLLALDRRKTVGWAVEEPLVIHRRGGRSERRERVAQLLDQVGLDPALMTRRPTELSGGQLQRINIARALALEPRLLVCDEAVSALDVSVQAQIVNLLLEIQQRIGTAMLFISHDLAVVRHLSDRIAVMYAGQIVEEGPAGPLTDDPMHPYSRALLAAALDLHDERVLEVRTRPAEDLPTHGCRFAPRCPAAGDRCSAEEPLRRELAPQRSAACHFAGVDPPTGIAVADVGS